MLVRHKLVFFEWLEIVLLKVWMDNIQNNTHLCGTNNVDNDWYSKVG